MSEEKKKQAKKNEINGEKVCDPKKSGGAIFFVFSNENEVQVFILHNHT